MQPYYHTTMQPCYHATMLPCNHACYHATMLPAAMLPRYNATMLLCYHATMQPCNLATMQPCYHATMLPCNHATMQPNSSVQFLAWTDFILYFTVQNMYTSMNYIEKYGTVHRVRLTADFTAKQTLYLVMVMAFNCVWSPHLAWLRSANTEDRRRSSQHHTRTGGLLSSIATLRLTGRRRGLPSRG